MSLSMRSFSLLVLCSFSPLLFAADVPGSQDLPIVPRMVDARIVDYRPATELERIYPLGSIRKISGQLRFDGQVSARGNVTSVTYELPSEHSSIEAFTAAREALQQQGAGLLFWCQARAISHPQAGGTLAVETAWRIQSAIVLSPDFTFGTVLAEAKGIIFVSIQYPVS